jgi:hypothetical protein
MKHIRFTSILLSLLIVSCQTEPLTDLENSEASATPALYSQKAPDVLDQIDFDAIQIRDGRLAFQSVDYFLEVMSLLNYAASGDDIRTPERLHEHFDGFTPLPYGTYDNVISKGHQWLLNEYGEVLIDGYYNIVYPDGSYDAIFEANSREIEAARAKIGTMQRIGEDCHYNLHANKVKLFEYCTSELLMQGELHLVNINNFHHVEGFLKCHKAADPNVMVPAKQLDIELSGELSIGCGIPITLDIPNDYNINLVGGQVPNSGGCHNCSSLLVRVSYSKDVTLIEGDDFLKGNFKLKMDQCGDVFTEEIELTMFGD